MKGIIVFYIEVGTLPPAKAEMFIERVKAQNKEIIEKLKADNYEALFVPLRPNSNTRVDFIPLDGFYEEEESWKKGYNDD